MEPMQYNNPDGKWQEEIPYMIINLEYDRDIYLGKDTIVVHMHGKRTKHVNTWRSMRSLNQKNSGIGLQKQVKA